MNIPSLLKLTLTLALSSECLLAGKTNAQVYKNECLQGTGSCAFQDYPQDNQNLYLRTPTQFIQRQVNRSDNICADDSSATCNQITPYVEDLQQSDTLQELRDRQINVIKNE